jgi:hypothetical protein
MAPLTAKEAMARIVRKRGLRVSGENTIRLDIQCDCDLPGQLPKMKDFV